MRHRGSFGPSSRSRSRRVPRAFALVGLTLVLAGCATWNPPPPRAAENAAAAGVYSGSLRVSVKGAGVRGRSALLVAFRRPGSVRLEIPGSAGARLIAVVRQDRLTAVFPGHRAVLQGTATAADFDALLGVALAPVELMDMLVGVSPPRLKSFRVGWGDRLPERIEAVLPDGTKLKVSVDEAEIGISIPGAAFEFPGSDGYRSIDASEARRLLGGR